MGQKARKKIEEIQATREELGRKVDELVDRAKVEAGEVGKKLAVGAAALAGLLIVGIIAKRMVR